MADIDPRVRFASERTLLAWVRTGLAMMGFGFIVARLGVLLRSLQGAPEQHSATPSLWVGTSLVALSAFVQIAAALQHRSLLRRLEAGEADPRPAWSLGLVLATLLAALGIALAAYLGSLAFRTAP